MPTGTRFSTADRASLMSGTLLQLLLVGVLLLQLLLVGVLLLQLLLVGVLFFPSPPPPLPPPLPQAVSSCWYNSLAYAWEQYLRREEALPGAAQEREAAQEVKGCNEGEGGGCSRVWIDGAAQEREAAQEVKGCSEGEGGGCRRVWVDGAAQEREAAQEMKGCSERGGCSRLAG